MLAIISPAKTLDFESAVKKFSCFSTALYRLQRTTY
ncbi:Uncharacterised protein [Haemophilus influenzae]|uniref:Uncharacterized protein n=1 Tax=Haemophilus influenzae TaxID=727 RepID=A0A2X1PZ05_HAEIF|nr:Uncharacterised protein [Haemophilus influenzae]